MFAGDDQPGREGSACTRFTRSSSVDESAGKTRRIRTGASQSRLRRMSRGDRRGMAGIAAPNGIHQRAISTLAEARSRDVAAVLPKLPRAGIQSIYKTVGSDCGFGRRVRHLSCAAGTHFGREWFGTNAASRIANPRTFNRCRLCPMPSIRISRRSRTRGPLDATHLGRARVESK